MKTYKSTLFLSILALASTPSSTRCMGGDSEGTPTWTTFPSSSSSSSDFGSSAGGGGAIISSTHGAAGVTHEEQLEEYIKDSISEDFKPDDYTVVIDDENMSDSLKKLAVSTDKKAKSMFPEITARSASTALLAGGAVTAGYMLQNVPAAIARSVRSSDKMMTPMVSFANTLLKGVAEPLALPLAILSTAWFVHHKIEEEAVAKHKAHDLAKKLAAALKANQHSQEALRKVVGDEHNMLADTGHQLTKILAIQGIPKDAQTRITTLADKIDTLKGQLRQAHSEFPEIQKDPTRGFLGWFKNLCHFHQEHTIVHGAAGGK